MKKVKLLSKAEMKNVTGGNVCTTGNWNSYDICYNCSILYGTAPEQAARVCAFTSGGQTT
ncbi:hypothetical protein [Pedobacter kyonggii]|uniref:Bacteriocin n=1 Tax=Pedobacter kyonggii TaxID=1926871 RepID=A0A4Q9HCE4_9SPHI|nr:hypothetical protein [Pedobacter kyonggii]TBO42082.1 hypothetical protein EYS08_11140 [Pedobacter kyonggii]